MLVFASFAFGVRDVTFGDVVAGMRGQTDTIAEAAVAARVPRTLLGVLAGAALAISGAVMQGITRNPIADPGILGVTSGAAFAVVLGLAAFGLSSSWGFIGMAIIGAAGAAAFVYGVGSLGPDGATPLKLALAGAAVTAALTSLVAAVLLPRADLMQGFQSWQIGGLGGADWPKLAALAPVIVLGLAICLAGAGGLNALSLGDDVAVSLGVQVTRTRLIAATGAVILAGAVTAIAGPIAFVGLVVPHLCRILAGADYRWLLPLSGIAGAILMLASDVIGRLVAPTNQEIQVGIVTALIGAPVFIWVVRKRSVRAL